MPAATRCRAAVAALGILLITLLPGTPPAAAAPAAGITVAVFSGGAAAPEYRIEVRNETAAPMSTTVRQMIPRDARPQTIGQGGRAESTALGGTEISWWVQLPAHGTTTLHTSLQPPRTLPVAAPACAFVGGGPATYHCATALWGQDQSRATPWWQRPVVLVGLGVAVLTVTALAWWWLARRRRSLRRVAVAGPARRGPVPDPVRPMVPPRARRRRAGKPPTWQVVSLAGLLLLSLVVLIIWFGGTQVAAFGPSTEPTSGAWVGTAVNGRIGMTVRDSSFEFTVYRLGCTPEGDRQRCVANVGMRNHSAESQMWYAGMQRAYLPSGTWVGADAPATRAANGGQDFFTHPIPPGGHLLAPLVFLTPEQPTRIELRSGAFSAGVSVTP